ncbi:MAG: M48 family metallopeptidase, partial [Muribaculaceae bacterium]|nr:M48 family metallopeptidase [Muribaculaceae bacterium]
MILTSSTIGFTGCSSSRLDMNSLLTGASKVIQASTISDSQIRGYVQEYIAYSDQQNKVAPANNPYAVRLARLTSGLTSVDGVPLNFKVYLTNDVNAFACADGSVRVYSGLMDRMTDDEVLGVIGHEIGHVAHKDTKNAFKNALLTSALLDGVASTGGTAAALTRSQLGQLGESLVKAKYSQKQESNADDYGYDFLKANGKNPWSMAMAFQKLGSMEGSAATNGMQQMFSSHP